MKWAFTNQAKPIPIKKNELENIIQKVEFYDVIKNKIRKVGHLQKKYILLTLFTSTCTGCEENSRIRLIKEIAASIEPNKLKMILLFSGWNNIGAIKQYADLNEWDKSQFTVGIIENSKGTTEKELYKLFELDTDPRTFIINSDKKILFAETRKTSKLINLEYIRALIK